MRRTSGDDRRAVRGAIAPWSIPDPEACTPRSVPPLRGAAIAPLASLLDAGASAPWAFAAVLSGAGCEGPRADAAEACGPGAGDAAACGCGASADGGEADRGGSVASAFALGADGDGTSPVWLIIATTLFTGTVSPSLTL